MSQQPEPENQFDPTDAFAVPSEWDADGQDSMPEEVPSTVFGAGSVERSASEADFGVSDESFDVPVAPLPPMAGASSAPPAHAIQMQSHETWIDPEETLAPVPRITVSAFCERPETAQMVEQTGTDRRMSRAHFTTAMGGLPAAIEQYHDEGTPNLILIESGMRGQGLFDQLDELASVCDAGTKVVVIGAANDIALYRELIRRGVSEYLVPPLVPLQLVRTISGLFADPDKPFAGKVTAVIGAKGGVGSSTLAHNLAWQISENCRVDTTIVDLDLSFGTAGLDFNQDTNQGIGDALEDPERVDDVLLERLLTRCTDRLSMFTAPATLDREWELNPEAFETVISEVRSTVPQIILDLPHTWSPWVKNTLLLADEVVIVATPDLACLRNAKNMFDLLQARRANDFPPKIVVNQVGLPKRPEISIKDFAEALGVEPALVLPFDPELFGQANNNGQMLSEIDAASKAVAGIQSLATELSGKEDTTKIKKTGLLSKLLGRG
ncbi:Type II/IV secretion system ATPase TadZ/CpaE, associated with Flp pilus assembly [hydrothermal vent metagenome]|uniref:Type II/IV secretion system ATPase TadZ/CpaE, associated with Flp pilus assembly n=1 Tax=hydrothermal vent metagenome TaxID=652676 RepID=A0A3B0RX61_9ZZZZ